jgi:hypothetical protein
MAKGVATATPNFFKIFFIKNKKLWAIWKILDTIGQIEKKLELWRGWITKIESLVFELKNVVNFGGVNCNFSLVGITINMT